MTRISKILTNSWVITLSATLIGVFSAMYLNEWVASKKLRKEKVIATQNIQSEMDANQEKLVSIVEKHTKLFDILEFLRDFVNEEDELVAAAGSLTPFRNKYPNVVIIKDSTLLDNGLYEYGGDINLDLSYPNFNLTSVAWESLKNSGFSTSYGFQCLMYLETIDQLTEEVLVKNKELLEFFTGVRNPGDQDEYLISHLKMVVGLEESLLELYQKSTEEFINCR